MTVLVPLTKGMFALVDRDDYDAVMAAGNWVASSCDGHWYARHAYVDQFRQNRTISMHTLLTGWSLVDHRNGDGLDNRRENLRPATPTQNLANMRRSSVNTSGYKGVHFYKRTGRWRAYIGVGGKSQHLGYTATAVEAALMYDTAARDLWGDYALTNFPKETAA